MFNISEFLVVVVEMAVLLTKLIDVESTGALPVMPLNTITARPK